MKSYPFTGRFNIGQLADELVAAGVPMGGEAKIVRNAHPLATNITIIANDDAIDATVNSVVSAHTPVGVVDPTALAELRAEAQADATTKANAAAAAAIAASATAAQGAAADSALQPNGNGSSLTGLTKGQVGLANVDNTADNDKPLSATATTTVQNLVNTYVPNASYRTILQAGGSHTASRVAGTYGLGHGDPLAISGTGTLYALAIIDIAAADYPTVAGKAAKLRIRASLETNNVAPFTGTFTVGLHPISRPANSGGAGLVIYTIDPAVSGSTAVFTNPPVDANLSAVGADFALPADGRYVLGVVTSATMAASSHCHINASLQMRNN